MNEGDVVVCRDPSGFFRRQHNTALLTCAGASHDKTTNDSHKHERSGAQNEQKAQGTQEGEHFRSRFVQKAREDTANDGKKYARSARPGQSEAGSMSLAFRHVSAALLAPRIRPT